ncbi:MAG: RraA family protein [Candidatus Aminicenantes bacterium]|nr:RraA family protein [Candidatus Aminicenantes bacterium]
MDFKKMRERLLKIDTTCLCDAQKKIRALDPGMRPLCPDLKLVGRAYTVQCCDDFLTVIKALQDAAAGEVLVIDGQGGRKALAGEMFTTEACRKGLAGMIIDGVIRDIKTIQKMNFPVYYRSVFPVSGSADKIFKTQIPISCGGVTIHPGDILLGDADGVVVASSDEMTELLPLAEKIQRTESITLKKMEKGESLLDMLNFQEHYSRVMAQKDSKLEFKF